MSATTRVIKAPHEVGADLASRIALFAVVSGHPRGEQIIQGLAPPHAETARLALRDSRSWTSAKRQARIALEFGVRGDAMQRLNALLTEAHPGMKWAMFSQMSAGQQARFPELEGQRFREVPGRIALAARLVWEASR